MGFPPWAALYPPESFARLAKRSPACGQSRSWSAPGSKSCDSDAKRPSRQLNPADYERRGRYSALYQDLMSGALSRPHVRRASGTGRTARHQHERHPRCQWLHLIHKHVPLRQHASAAALHTSVAIMQAIMYNRRTQAPSARASSLAQACAFH